MSVLRKKPFIEELLEALSAEEISRLSSIINQAGNPELVTLSANMGNPIPSSAPAELNSRIKLVNLALTADTIYTGILIYHSTSYCGFVGTVAFENDIIKLFKINVSIRKVEPINEKLTADELRRVIDDMAEAKGAAPELEDKLSFISASNINALTDSQINGLKVGDVVQKITGQQKHCYIVTYKQEKHGICLSYSAAGYLETVSYDYVGGHWVYNSTDIVSGLENALKMPSDLDPAKSYTLKIVGGVLTAVEDE